MVTRRGFEGVFGIKFLLAIAVVAAIFIFARPSLGLWTIALLAIIFMFYMGFADVRTDYPENRYRIK